MFKTSLSRRMCLYLTLALVSLTALSAQAQRKSLPQTPIAVMRFDPPGGFVGRGRNDQEQSRWAIQLGEDWQNWSGKLQTEIINQLVRKKVTLVERSRLGDVEQEEILSGGKVNAAKAAALGEKIGARILLVGGVEARYEQDPVEKRFFIDMAVRAVSVESGKILHSYDVAVRRVKGFFNTSGDRDMTLKVFTAAAEELAKQIEAEFPQLDDAAANDAPPAGLDNPRVPVGAPIGNRPGAFRIVEAEGQASVEDGNRAKARETARHSALAAAVEKVMGVYVTSETRGEDFEVVQKRILARSEGLAVIEQTLSELEGDDILRLKCRVKVFLTSAPDGKESLWAAIRSSGALRQLRIMVVIPETHIRRPVPDPAVETAILRTLTSEGFRVVDQQRTAQLREATWLRAAMQGTLDRAQAEALRTEYGADILITGEAFSTRAEADRGGNSTVLCGARSEVKVIMLDTGEIITADSVPQAQGRGLSEELAAKIALENAGKMVAPRLVSALIEKAFTATGSLPGSRSARVQLEISNWKQRQEAKQLLNALEKMTGVKTVTLTEYQSGTLFAEVELTPEAVGKIADWLETGPEFLPFGIGIDTDKKTKIVARAHAVEPEPEEAPAKQPESTPAKKPKPPQKPKKG